MFELSFHSANNDRLAVQEWTVADLALTVVPLALMASGTGTRLVRFSCFCAVGVNKKTRAVWLCI